MDRLIRSILLLAVSLLASCSAAKEERKRRVTVVRPGAVATPLWDKMPVRLPRSAISPAELAAKIMAAHVEGHSGVLDV